MKKFGLIGHPISHSLSPALFKAGYNGLHTYDLIEEADFEKAFERFAEGYDAINVTAPFKELAYRKAKEASDACKAIGAANILTITGDDRFVRADNSDVDGVVGSLCAAGVENSAWKAGSSRAARKALIVGCGGAAMAAAYATAVKLGLETVIINRNVEKAKRFVERMNKTVAGTRIRATGLETFRQHFKNADVIVYTLPVAVPAIEELDRRELRGAGFWHRRKKKTILEANYKDPAFTPELKNRLQKVNPDIEFISGKEWLLYQAIGAYEHFGLSEPDIDAMRKVIEY